MTIFDQNEQFQRNHQNMSIFNLSTQTDVISPLSGSSVKWTFLGQSERSMGVKLDGSNDWKWTVCESEWSLNQKMDGPNALIFMDRPLQNFWYRPFNTFISLDRPLSVKWPSTMTHGRSFWLKRRSLIVPDRPLWCKWPFTFTRSNRPL